MKKVLILIVILLSSFMLTGCKDKEEAGILFNNEPITRENVMHASRNFEAGKRIYYLFYSPENLNMEFIRVQVFKAADNVHVGGYSILWAKDYRVMHKQSRNYFYNNFTIHAPGKYVMQVFNVHDIAKPLAWNYFFVN